MSIRPLMSRCVAVPTVALMLFQSSGCDREIGRNGEPPSSIRQAAPDMSDEALFREVVFPNETSAAKVPALGRVYEALHLEQFDENQHAALQTFQDLLVDQIVHDHPQFVAEFAANMTSGDPLLVEAALLQSRGVIIEATSALSGDLQGLMSAESLDDLQSRIDGQYGADVDLVERLEGMDPEALHGMLELLYEHLEQYDVPLDPSLGGQYGIATAVDVASVVDASVAPDPDADGALYLTHDIAVYTWGVAAVAVVAVVAAVAVAVVAGFVVAPLQGQSSALFRDEVVAGITEAYAA